MKSVYTSSTKAPRFKIQQKMVTVKMTSSASSHFHPKIFLVSVLLIRSLSFSLCLFLVAPLLPLASESSFRLAPGKKREEIVLLYVSLTPAIFHIPFHQETSYEAKAEETHQYCDAKNALSCE